MALPQRPPGDRRAPAAAAAPPPPPGASSPPSPSCPLLRPGVFLAEMLLLLLPPPSSPSPPSLRGAGAGRGAPCPSPSCFCFSTPDTDQCRYLRLDAPPEDLPEAVRDLTVVGGNLTALRGAAFAGGWAERGAGGGVPRRPLPDLTLLVLTHDGIEALEEGAFAGLPALATLDLSHNPLRAVDPAAFAAACCRRLRTLRLNQALLLAPGGAAEALLDGALANLSLARLELRGNRLREPPPGWALPPSLEELDVRNNSLRALRAERLDGWAALPRLRLQLAPNPLDCECAALRPLLEWQRNASWRAPDARALRCAAPPGLKDAPLRRLRPFQLGCPEGEAAAAAAAAAGWGLLDPGPAGPGDPELETASYVFFGIVLALIGVVFLMVLYLNRRGIKRWLNNLREACRDQMEGYHYRYEQDSDPRRAGPGDL